MYSLKGGHNAIQYTAMLTDTLTKAEQIDKIITQERIIQLHTR